jgi:lipoyl(octanoyl) transferase
MRLAHIHLPGITPFSRVSSLQQMLTTAHLAHKRAISPPPSTSPTASSAAFNAPPDPAIITFTPNPVYTTGRRDLPPSNTVSPASAELSLPPSLEAIRSLLTTSGDASSSTPVAEYHPTLRGGQTTYHGPGQLVAYTILDLRRLGLTPRCHIHLLEHSAIDVLRTYNVEGFTTDDPGVWVGSAPATAKKITAVGAHLRRHISSFGIGLNVTEEPIWFFKQIVACGLEGREATSLEGQGVKGVSVDEVADGFVAAFVNRLRTDFAPSRSGRAGGEGVEEVYKLGLEDVVALEKECRGGKEIPGN